MICIVDYGMGNLSSVKNALDHIGVDSIISSHKEDLIQSDAIILPGVGAFKEAMDNLKKYDLVETLKEEAKRKPFLGICLGMQLMFEKGYEVEECEGLGLFKGTVEQMKGNCKIPQIGFNRLEINHPSSLVKENSFVYFVHSFYAQNYEDKYLIAYSDYGDIKVPAMFQNETIVGCQFHPEKSGEDGLAILRKFKEMIPCI